ncbi:winged helix-turn-helix transcriptional regulator [Streptomyces sp. 8N706]|uniref:winged helix-turn-helix transcriptional regulator n=1 Tax=Streptomyces sp. 8N706 TaxID=3457416 RepID=UPI003FD4686F
MANASCPARHVLARIGERWTMHVCNEIATGATRFSDLKAAIGCVSPKVLSETLVRLEQDGLIERRVFDSRPPRVTYELTPLGESLLQLVRGIVNWSRQHGPLIEAARRAYDTHDSRELQAPKVAL